jgi:hypothetical protein
MGINTIKNAAEIHAEIIKVIQENLTLNQFANSFKKVILESGSDLIKKEISNNLHQNNYSQNQNSVASSNPKNISIKTCWKWFNEAY